MWKVKRKDVAQQIAKEKTLDYGHSVFDGFFYVGTVEQLRKIGVIIIRPTN